MERKKISSKKQKSKKGQGLPLNTIVIAILVILVLLVIVVFFTNNVGKTGDTLENKGNIGSCSVDSNPSLKTLGYKSAIYLNKEDCLNRGGKVISIVSKNENGEICCGWK